MEAFGHEVVAGLRPGDFHIAAADFRGDSDEGTALAIDGLVETGGEHAVFEAGGAEEGLLGDGDALDGEELLGVDGLVAGDQVFAEPADVTDVFDPDDGERGGGESVLAGVLGGAALPSGERGPVERAAFARLATSCFWDTGFLVFGMVSSALRDSIRGGWSPKLGTGKR